MQRENYPCVHTCTQQINIFKIVADHIKKIVFSQEALG